MGGRRGTSSCIRCVAEKAQQSCDSGCDSGRVDYNECCGVGVLGWLALYRRTGFDYVVKQLRMALYKPDCDFNDCELPSGQILLIAYSFSCDSFDRELWKNSQFAIKRISQSKPDLQYSASSSLAVKVYTRRCRCGVHLTPVIVLVFLRTLHC